MMISDAALLYLIAHILGDYYFRKRGPTDEKEHRSVAVVVHGLYYAATMMLLSAALALLGSDRRIILAGAIVSALHLLADFITFAISAKNKARENTGAAALYLSDQLVHWAAVLVVIEWFYVRHLGCVVTQPIPREMIKWGVLLMLILKPGNITFRKLFSKYEDLRDDASSEPGAGALIGSLERVLCAIFLALDQYAAIGLIYTAKSIARFKKIELNQRFAEYYLIGTLFSILYVLVSFLVIMRVVR